MEVKVSSGDFLSDDPEVRRRALNLKTIKGADKLKFTMKSKPFIPKTKPSAANTTASSSSGVSLVRSLSVHAGAGATTQSHLFSEGEYPPLTEEEKRRALENAAEVLSMFDRSLKYEVIEEAELVQLNVIDNRDGTVVRKIPADVVVEFVMALKERIDNAETETEEQGQREREGIDVKA
jgi:hypothetical protein